MKHAAALGIRLALLLPVVMLNGWGLGKLWMWFAVPLGVPVISLGQAIGLSLLVAYLTHQVNWTPDSMKDKPFERLVRDAAYAGLKPVVCVGTGWLYLQVFF
jgi:hypothetical protein